MKKLSKRHIIREATIEMTNKGVGVSAGARKYVRNALPEYAKVRNAELNEVIAEDFLKQAPYTRFVLNQSFQGIGEIRKGSNYYYVALVRGRGTTDAGYDVISILPAIKTVTDQMRKLRLQPGWGAE